MTALPQHAARAAQETRERAIRDALDAYESDIQGAAPGPGWYLDDTLTVRGIQRCRTALTACLSHLDEIERHLPGSARQGQVRDVAEGDPAYLEEQGR